MPPGEPPRFALLTTEPNSIVQPIHAKSIPVILPQADAAAWLAGIPAHIVQQPFAAEQLFRL